MRRTYKARSGSCARSGRLSVGAVRIKGAKGKVTAKTTFERIAIEAENATVNAQNSSGAIQFAGQQDNR